MTATRAIDSARHTNTTTATPFINTLDNKRCECVVCIVDGPPLLLMASRSLRYAHSGIGIERSRPEGNWNGFFSSPPSIHSIFRVGFCIRFGPVMRAKCENKKLIACRQDIDSMWPANTNAACRIWTVLYVHIASVLFTTLGTVIWIIAVACFSFPTSWPNPTACMCMK